MGAVGLLVAIIAIALVLAAILVRASLRVVREDERLVVFRLGRTGPSLLRGPGLVALLPVIDRAVAVTIGERALALAGLEASTIDGWALTADVTARYQVVDPIASVLRPTAIEDTVATIARRRLDTAAATMTLEEAQTPGALGAAMAWLAEDELPPWGGRITGLEVGSVAATGRTRSTRQGAT